MSAAVAPDGTKLNFHTQCLKCIDCEKPILDKYKAGERGFLCTECANPRCNRCFGIIDGGAQYFLDPATRSPVCAPCWTGAAPVSQLHIINEHDMMHPVGSTNNALPMVTQSFPQQQFQQQVVPQIVSQHHGVVQHGGHMSPMQLPSHISPILQPPPAMQTPPMPQPMPYPVEHQAAASGPGGPRLLGPFTGPPPPGAMIVPAA